MSSEEALAGGEVPEVDSYSTDARIRIRDALRADRYTVCIPSGEPHNRTWKGPYSAISLSWGTGRVAVLIGLCGWRIRSGAFLGGQWPVRPEDKYRPHNIPILCSSREK